MATIVSKKFPLDLTPSTAIGFGFPLNGDAVFNPTYQTRDQIRANLINFLLTNKGERVFNPEFGADLRLLLFDFQDDVELGLREIMQDQIGRFFPTITINQFDITKLENQNTIQLSVIYSIQSFGISDSISINLQ